MFDLALPWWEFAVRGAACYLGLLILLRLAGKRSFGEMSPFDIVVLILVGGGLRSAMVGNDASLLGPLISVAAIIALDKLLSFIAAVVPAFDTFLEGHSAVLARKGRLLPGALRRHCISSGAFERELRVHGLRELGEVDEARIEANGRVTMLKRARRS